MLSQAVDDLVHAALRDFSVGAALFTMVCWSHSLEATRASISCFNPPRRVAALGLVVVVVGVVVEVELLGHVLQVHLCVARGGGWRRSEACGRLALGHVFDVAPKLASDEGDRCRSLPRVCVYVRGEECMDKGVSV